MPDKFEIPKEGGFTFKTKEIAEAFDDHVREQLPWYDLTSRSIRHIANHFITNGGTVYDIGAATGNIGQILHETINERHAKLIAIEPSATMAEMYRGGGELVQANVQHISFQPYDFAVSHLSLMFLSKADRADVLRKLIRARKPGGCLVLLEKMISAQGYAGSVMMRLILSEKLNAGASPDDIISKELSLAGVQLPFTYDEIPEEAIEWFRFADFVGYMITD